MTQAKERISRRGVDKFAQRREQLAESALQALAELGYARTSLREIAQKSDFSHGVLHYYFADKVELLTYSVRKFEEICVTHYDDVVAEASTAADLERGLAKTMTTMLRTDATMHRLWYDLRNQSMFQAELTPVIQEIDGLLERMIWTIVTRYAELRGADPVVESPLAYAMYDGMFEQALVAFLTGDLGALDAVAENCGRLLRLIVP